MTQSGHPVIGSSSHRRAPNKGLHYFAHIDFVFLVLINLAGCTHSHVIQVTVANACADKVSTITIDYPEATFGINALEPGKSFQYKIKPTATGALKIEFRDAQGRNHVSSGPMVHKGDEGSIIVKLAQSGATADLRLQ